MWNSFIERICEIWRSGTMRRKYFWCLFFFFFRSFVRSFVQIFRWLLHLFLFIYHLNACVRISLYWHPLSPLLILILTLCHSHTFSRIPVSPRFCFSFFHCLMFACFCWFCLHKSHQIGVSVPTFWHPILFFALMHCRSYLSFFYFASDGVFSTLSWFITFYFQWIHWI